jgi:flagellar basal body L-ring protein FlgH
MKRWILAALALGTAAQADDLYPKGASAGLVADRAAENVGDILTIVVVENNLAANTAQNGSRKNSRIAGELGIGKIVNGGAHLNLGSDYEGTGNTLRSGRMAAQFSVAVEACCRTATSGSQAPRRSTSTASEPSSAFAEGSGAPTFSTTR